MPTSQRCSPGSARSASGACSAAGASIIAGSSWRWRSGELRLKADAESAPQFEAAGARRLTYETKNGGTAAMPYWSVPEEALDDPDAMARWVRLAYEAAVRADSRG